MSAPFRLSVRTNAGEAGRALALEVRGIDDWSKPTEKGAPLWQRLYPVWLQSRRRLFDSRGSSEGGPVWEYTPAEREHYTWYKGAVLTMTQAQVLGTVLRWEGSDTLMLSLSTTTSRYAWARWTRTSAVFASTLRWAATNQHGIGRAPMALGGHSIPARDMLRIGPRTEARLERELVDYVAARIADTVERVTADAAAAMPRRMAR